MKRSTCLWRIPFLSAAATLVVQWSAFAADGTWNHGADGQFWGAAANWSGGVIGDGSGFAANFNAVDLPADTAVHLDSARTLGILVIGDLSAASAGGWQLDNAWNAANILTLAGGTPAITVNALGAGKLATISLPLAGSAGLVKSGAGSLALAAQATFTGQTTINQGVLAFGGGDHTLRINNALQVNGGTLDLGSRSQYAGSLSSAAAGEGTGGTITGTGGTLSLNQSSAGTFAGSIGGGVSLVKAGAQALTLSSAQTSTGQAAVLAGTLRLLDGGALATTNGIVVAGGTLAIDNSGSKNLADRIGDAAPVTLKAGTISLAGANSTNTTETLGTVTITDGVSLATATPGSGAASAVLSISTLARSTGAGLNVNPGNASNLGMTNAPYGNIKVGTFAGSNLAAVNGVVPGVFSCLQDAWYLVGYDEGKGFGILGTAGYPANYSGAFAAAGPTSNLFSVSGAVASNVTVNSINQGTFTFTNGTATGGADLLTIGSGMAIMGSEAWGTPAQRGKITSGTQELFILHRDGNATPNPVIHSVIVDNGNPVSVSVYSKHADRGPYVVLTAPNQYSGGTFVTGGAAQGGILLYATDAGTVVIPAGGLTINNQGVVDMATFPGQIDPGNVVTINGGGVLNLMGTNTLAGIVFNSNGGTTTPSVVPYNNIVGSLGNPWSTYGSKTGLLTLTGGIVSMPSNPAVTPLIDSGYLDLNGAPAFSISVSALPQGNFVNYATPLKGLTISSVIRNGGIAKKGDGVLELAGANTFAGQLTVESGVLCVGSVNNAGAAGPLGSNTTSVVLGSGGVTGTLEYTGGTATSTKPFTLAAGASGAFQVDSAATTLTLASLIDGDGGLVKAGAGALSLSGTNTYAGVTVMAAGTLQANHASDALGSGGSITFTGGALQFTAVSKGADWSARIKDSTGAIALDSNGQTVTLAGILDGSNTGGLTKSGAGVLVLAGANAYGGITAINGGTLKLGAADVIPDGAGKGTVMVAGTLDLGGFSEGIAGLNGPMSGVIDNSTGADTYTLTAGNNDADGTFCGVIRNTSGAVALTKTGSGTLRLSGNNTHGGATAVAAGRLVGVCGGSCSNSAVTVAGGAALGVRSAAAAASWSCGALTFAAGVTSLEFDFGALSPSAAVAPLQVAGDLALAGTLNVSVRGSGVLREGTYPLIRYGGSLTGVPPVALAALPEGVSATLVNNTAAKSIDLNITAGNQLAWAVGDGEWNSTDPNWRTGLGGITNYADGEAVKFDDTASGSSPITVSLGTVVSPADVTVSAGAKSYTLSGAGGIAGLAGLTKSGDGVFTNGCANSSFTGPLALKAGTMSVSVVNDANANGPLGGSALPVSLGDTGGSTGTLQYTAGTAASTKRFTLTSGGAGAFQVDNAGATLTLSALVDGGGKLLKTGGGSLALAGAANTYTGKTEVAGGRLAISGDQSLGAVPAAFQADNITLENGATLRAAANGLTVSANRGITLGAGMQSLERVSRWTAGIAGVISGSGGLILTDTSGPGADGGGGAALNLSNANTYTGDTRLVYLGVGDPAVINFNHALALQYSTLDFSAANVPAVANIIRFNSGIGSYTLGGLKGDKPFNLSYQGNTAHTLRIGNNNQDTTYSGVISSSGDANAGITKIGTGKLTLSAANTYSGETAAGGGVLELAHSLALQSSVVNYDNQGGALSFGSLTAATFGGLKGAQGLALTNASGASVALTVGNNTAAAAYFGALSGSGSLVKIGAGTQTLAGASTHAGTTTVSAGRLALVAGGSSANSDAVVSPASGLGILGVLVTSPGASWSVRSLTTSGAGTPALAFDFADGVAPGTTTAPLQVQGAVTYTTLPTVSVAGLGAQKLASGGRYPLIQSTAAMPASLPALLLPPHMSGSLELSGDGRTLYLVMAGGTGNVQPLTWAGTNGAPWDINVSTNWTDSALAGAKYQEATLAGVVQGDAVVFDDSVGGEASVTVTVAATVSPVSVTVSNDSRAYTLAGSGKITGSAALVKGGGNTLRLTGANTYTGGTFVNGGTLSINNGNAVNNANTTLNGASLVMDAYIVAPPIILGPDGGTVPTRNAWVTYNNDISGAGKFYYYGSAGGGQDDRFARAAGYSLTGDFVVLLNGGGARISQLPNSTLDLSGGGMTLNTANPVFGGLKGSQNLNMNGYVTQIGNNGRSTTYAGVLSNGGLNKIGTGTLVLGGANSYAGGTTVSSGMLVVTNTTGSGTGTGAVTVKSGAALGGTGTISGALTVESGAHLAPGFNSAATLALGAGSLNFNGGAVLDCEIGGSDASPTNDLVNLTAANSTIVFGSTATVNLSRAAGATLNPAGKTFVLFDYKGANPATLPTWTINYGATGWSYGSVSIDAANTRVILTGVGPIPVTGGILTVR